MDRPILVEMPERVWQFEELTPGIQKAFSAWCAARARREIYEQKADLPPDAYKDAMASVTEEIAAGSYRMGNPFEAKGIGSGARRLLNSPDGRLKMALLMTEAAHGKNWTPEKRAELLVEDMKANPEAFADAIQEALGYGPNSASPAAKTGETTTPA